MNRQEFLGRLGKEIEVRKTAEGVSVINFSLADTVRREGKEPETTWLDFEAWRSAADNIAKYVRKGDLLWVAGETRNKKYTDKDGNVRRYNVVMVKEYRFLPNARKEQTEATEAPADVTGFEGEDWY